VEKRSGEYPKSERKKALQLYLEGLGFRSIGRYLGVSNITNVVHNGTSIKNLIEEAPQKVFFDKTENIFVISLFRTGELGFSTDKIQHSYVLSLKAAECPYKNEDYKKNEIKAGCPIYNDKLDEMLCFYNEK
jgi:hypothetical protein